MVAGNFKLIKFYLPRYVDKAWVGKYLTVIVDKHGNLSIEYWVLSLIGNIHTQLSTIIGNMPDIIWTYTISSSVTIFDSNWFFVGNVHLKKNVFLMIFF